MAPFNDAQEIYRLSREVLELTRDLAVTDDLLRWLRDDLEEALLDLKLAVVDLDVRRVGLYIHECRWLLAGTRKRVAELKREPEQ